MFKSIVHITGFSPLNREIAYEITNLLPTDNHELVSSKGTIYTPVKGDRLWFYPGCDIPRFKVKQFCQKYDVAVVKYRDKSNVRFIGADAIDQLVIRQWLYQVNKDYFLTWLRSVMCNAYLQLEQNIIESKDDHVYLKYAPFNYFGNEELFGKKVLEVPNALYKNIHATLPISDEAYQHIINLVSDTAVLHQDAMLSLLNTGTVMTKDMYDEACKMFQSSDTGNTKLGMEAMANCDFQHSAVYLLLLMKEHGKSMFGSGNRHHVNFKSLLKYFNLSTYDLQTMTVDKIINSLRHQKLLSLDNLNMILPLALEVLKKGGDMQNIKIKDLELSADAEKAVAENILDQPFSSNDIIDEPTTIQEHQFAPILDSAPGAFK